MQHLLTRCKSVW